MKEIKKELKEIKKEYAKYIFNSTTLLNEKFDKEKCIKYEKKIKKLEKEMNNNGIIN